MAEVKPNPAELSGDFKAMQADWKKADNILGGIDVLRTNAATYLPKFPEEPDDVYEFRKQSAKFTNIYGDIVENLAARPFAEDVKLSEDVTDTEMQEFAEDVDAQGRSLHEFAAEAFHNAVGYGVDWLVVDYTDDVPEGEASVAAERAAGVRAFWRRYTATNCIAVYSAMVDGEEQFIHARFREWKTVRNQFKEELVERVRVWDREKKGKNSYGGPTVAVWEKKQKDEKSKEKEWVLVSPPAPISIDVIPLVPMMTARRKGASWKMHLPMKDAADLQIEHFQQDSAIKYARTMAAFPVLTGNGISPPKSGADGKISKLVVGPNAVLYAPPAPGGGPPPFWDWIEPSAESLTFLQNDLKETAKELRELGRQPLTSHMGNITVITSAVAGAKAQAAVQTWAMNMKKAIERALDLTALWMKRPDIKATISVNMDFDLSWTEDDGFDHVLSLRSTNDISRAATIHEAKRRKIIDKDYDAEEDVDVILEEMESLPESDPPIPAGGGAPPIDEPKKKEPAPKKEQVPA